MPSFRPRHPAAAAAISGVSACLLFAAPAEARDWTLLGARTVLDRSEFDRIPVGHRRFDEIRLCVLKARVRFHDVEVRFERGTGQTVAMRNLVRAGECTRPIDLRGNSRDIEAVIFRYETASPGPERAKVALYGR